MNLSVIAKCVQPYGVKVLLIVVSLSTLALFSQYSQLHGTDPLSSLRIRSVSGGGRGDADVSEGEYARGILNIKSASNVLSQSKSSLLSHDKSVQGPVPETLIAIADGLQDVDLGKRQLPKGAAVVLTASISQDGRGSVSRALLETVQIYDTANTSSRVVPMTAGAHRSDDVPAGTQHNKESPQILARMARAKRVTNERPDLASTKVLLTRQRLEAAIAGDPKLGATVVNGSSASVNVSKTTAVDGEIPFRTRSPIAGQNFVASSTPRARYEDDVVDESFRRNSNTRRGYYFGNQKKVTVSPPPPFRQWETYDYESAVGSLDIHVEHSPDVYSTTIGEPWPMPQHYLTSESFHTVDIVNLQFVSLGAMLWCDVLKRLVERYTVLIKKAAGNDGVGASPNDKPSLAGTDRPHSRLLIGLANPCTDNAMPHEGMDESYRLRVDSHAMELTAAEVWGVMRGLETFSQLLHARGGVIVVNETIIRDYPSYGYRGVMLDTARHFLSLDKIKSTLDAMSYNKFSVFHWHIVDDNSFPYESLKYPELHTMGAFSSDQVYTVNDVKDIVNYARDRGIRVIPEFDTPGHTRSWGLAYPKLLTNCSAVHYPFGAINPIQQYTYDFFGSFFKEAKDVFLDNYVHIGGDEINYKCWLAVKEIREFMLDHNMTSREESYGGNVYERLEGKLLQGHYTQRLLEVMPANTKKIAWDEVFTAAVQRNLSREDLIVHVWQQGDSWQQLASSVLNEGFSVIVSACWYLNYISYGKDWHKYYECDLKSFYKYFDVTPEKRSGMLGGSVCLWSEYIDDTNVESTLWPRAIAAAEKLWSSELMTSPLMAEGRFEQQRCRMIRRGITAAPTNGPGSCSGSMKVKPPF